MMALKCLAASSKLKRTVGWTLLILGSLWLLAACAGTSGQNDTYHGLHSNSSPDLP
jgi:hypothetical protein